MRNIPFSTTEAELLGAFSEFGDISEVHVPKDHLERGKGFAFVQFQEPADALCARAAHDGSVFQGRLMHVLAAEPAKQQVCVEDLADDTKQRMGHKRISAMKRKQNA